MKNVICRKHNQKLVLWGNHYICPICLKEEENLGEISPTIGDNGDFSQQEQDKMDMYFWLKRLPLLHRKIVGMLIEGYNQAEICQKLKLSQRQYNKELDKIRKTKKP